MYTFVYMFLQQCTTGDGKTHYIESQLHHSPHPLRVTVNESFMPLNVIKKLSSLPFDVRNCAVFFNISLLPPGVSNLIVHLGLHCVLVTAVMSISHRSQLMRLNGNTMSNSWKQLGGSSLTCSFWVMLRTL